MKVFFSLIRATADRLTFLPWILALMAGLILVSTDLGHDLEQRLSNIRADILEKPASGEIVIVEIDARSLQMLDRWPWPRDYYAKALEKLNQAGATQIAFDIDFSSRSAEENDRTFADAIRKSEATIILPTFRQQGATGRSEFVENLPIPMLRENAFLASVNVSPDSRGQLNRYYYGTTTAATARPSLASMIAETPGHIDESFAIDQSIDPASIPRLSFIDLMRFDNLSTTLMGKKVLIGATAIELGDRYSVSRFGVIPGVVIQALASETLIQGTNLQDLGKYWTFLIAAALLFVCIISRKISSRGLIAIAFATAFALLVLLLTTEYFRLFTFSNVPALCFLFVFIVAQKFLSTTTALETSQYVDERSGLPNEAALLRDIATKGLHHIATARLADFRELLVLTNKNSRRNLFENLASRLKFLARDDRLYHVDFDMVAWIVKREYIDDIPGHFATAIALLQAPVMAGGTKIKIDATYGISNASLDESKIASEQALASGSKWAWHDDQFDQAIGQKHDLLVELDQAIEDQRLGVVYQPKWDISQNRLNGAEALVRWNHPERGMISPEIFIPLLEKAGRIDGLTFQVLQQTLNDLSRWNQRRPGLSCSVNISAKLLGDSDFVRAAIAMVDEARVDNRQIVFEVTETATLTDPEQSIIALELIQDSGIRVSIDDYGTGQSTLSYLQRLPVSEIKLDQSFVRTMTSDNANRVMVKSTIRMAHDLGLKIVAEGIEDQACFELLTQYGCDIGQGWYISKPVATAIFERDWLISGLEEARLSA
ncbi:MAG: EAL domain-containing protein [Parasphingorhabdus sp.]|nr:EAL domain-containing protein [Parasphingorhabdus sp.]